MAGKNANGKKADGVKLDYRQSGVNIDAANETKKGLKDVVRTSDPRVLNGIGAFGSLYDFSFPEYREPVLVLKTEEPGSKQLLAFRYDRYESIGFDMINHLINDCIVMGARPLAVQDAVICGKIEKDKVTRIIDGISRACQAEGCTLTGGEISEQPGVIPAGTYILTSSIVGVVEKSAVIDGSAIAVGDEVIGVASNGPHTNGYSLVRRLLELKPRLAGRAVGGVPFIDRLLEPHRCYYSHLKDLFPRKLLHGMAHITGGGITENLDRILPGGTDARIDCGTYKIPEVFSVIREEGAVSDAEMLRTFNLGIGLAIVCHPEHSGAIIGHLASRNIDAYRIGAIVKGKGAVRCHGTLAWNRDA